MDVEEKIYMSVKLKQNLSGPDLRRVGEENTPR